MVFEAAARECTLQMHPSARAAILAPAGRAAPALVEPAMLTPAVPAPQRRRKSAGCARQAAPRQACHRTPRFLVNCAHAAAAAAPPHCACLPVVPDKPRLCTLVSGSHRVHCMDAAAVQLSLPLQLSQLTGILLLEDVKPPNILSVSIRLKRPARAGRRPAAESAHSKTLQFRRATGAPIVEI